MRWIDVAKRKPKAEQPVLVAYKNILGDSRIVMASYIPPKTVLSIDFFYVPSPMYCFDNPMDESFDTGDFEEYDTEKNCNWVLESWWEWSWRSHIQWKVDGEVTRFRPLPKLP